MKTKLLILFVLLSATLSAQVINPRRVNTDTLKIKNPKPDTSTRVAVIDANGLIKYNYSAGGGGSVDTLTKIETRYHAGQTFQPIGSYAQDSSVHWVAYETEKTPYVTLNNQDAGLFLNYRDQSSAWAWPNNNSGTIFSFIPNKSSFVSGRYDTDINGTNIGEYSFSGGQNSISSKEWSISFGHNCATTDQGGIAVGVSDTCGAYGAQAFGIGNVTYGEGSFVAGESNYVNSNGGFAFGGQDSCLADKSIVMGIGLRSNTTSEVVFGRYNSYSTETGGATDRIFSIGNGTFFNQRSNALEVQKNGNTTINGTLSVTGGNSTNWNTAYGWGNHASAGYLTVETDPSVSAWAKSATKPTYTYSEVGAEPAFSKSAGIYRWSGSAITWDNSTYLTGLSAGTYTITATTSNALSGQYIDWNSSTGGSSIANKPTIIGYPSAGLAKSTGSAWGTSVTDSSKYWNDAYKMFGYINRYGWTIASKEAITLSFNPTDSTLTLTNPGTAVYLRGGRICSFTGNKTAKVGVSSPVAKAKWYFYISDDNGTLSATTTPWTLTEDYTGVPVAAVDWDHYGSPWKFWLQNELHQCVIDRETHYLNHKLIGSRLGVGGTISGYTASGTPTLARNTFQIDASTLIDEDLEHTLNRRSDPTTYGRNYIVFYRNASTSVWKSDTSSVPYRYTSGNYIQYDNAGTMTTGANSTFYNTYLLYTNLNDSARFVIIHGRAGFASITAAQAENPMTFDFTGFSPEAVIAWQLTWETSNAYTGVVGKCRLATAPRQLSIALSTTGSTTATATTPNIWTAVTGTRTGAATFTFSGTATDALKCTKSLFQCLKSDGTVGRYGYIKSASESGGTITATVVSTSALEANDYEFYIAYGEKVQGLDNNYRWTNEVPGTIVADASNYQGKYYLNTPDTMYFVSSQPDVITAASGTGAAATYNIYAGASALYSTAPDMGTAATLTDQVPATLQKINPGVNVTLRWLTSAGATTKCADASVKITWIPSSIIRAK